MSFAVLLSFVRSSYADKKIIVLKSGDTLLGEIVDRTDDQVSIQLKTGVLIRLSSDRIESIEDPVTKPQPTKAAAKKKKEKLDLRSVFRKPNPTPTPLNLVPLDLRLNYPRRRNNTPSTLRELPPILPITAATSTVPGAGLISTATEEFGEVVRTKGISKYRHNKESWRPTLVGTVLQTGDELSTLSGRIEIRSKKGAVIRLHPSTCARFSKGRVTIDKGKAWVEWKGEKTFSVFYGGMEAAIENAVVMAEYLQAGFKFVLMEGGATLYKRPEGEIVRGELKGPLTLLLDKNRDVISRKSVQEGTREEWKSWETGREGISSATTVVSGATSEVGVKPMEKDRLLEMKQLKNLEAAIEAFYQDLGRFPREQRPFFEDLVKNPGSEDWKGPYLKEVTLPLLDRWGSELLYRLRTDPVTAEVGAEVYSLGPNKTFEKGEGDDLGILVNRPGS